MNPFDLWISVALETPGMNVRSPVTVRGTAIFDSSADGFRRVFSTEIVEHGHRGDE